MCGIAGVLASADLNDDDLVQLKTVNGALFHRGPDSDGFFTKGNVALAMRRLSIVDLAGGKQPLFNQDNTTVLVCNGEIYNHHELRSDLQSQGYSFKTHSDVETILPLYEKRGDLCVGPLRGMFAFALWDERKQQLLLGRDRLGEKPLYIYRDRRADGVQRLWFCSELRALLNVVPPDLRQLSIPAIHQFLTWQYITGSASPIAGITQLPAGHILSVSPQKLDVQSRQYWSLHEVPEVPLTNPKQTVIDTFDEACRRMGSADVPVGVALSGGIDSSLVAAVTARHYPGQIHAFSVGYKGRPVTDERDIAQRFAKSLGIPYIDIEIDIEELIEDFPRLVGNMDTPVGDIAAYGYYAVSKAARDNGVPVLLSGMGGDEFFWGYDWVRSAVGRNSAGGNEPDKNIFKWWKRKLPASDSSIFEGHQELQHAEKLSREFCLGRGLAEGDWLSMTRPQRNVSPDIAVSEVLNGTWLIGNCLTLLDRMSMAHSIELRVPFLDIDLVNSITGMRRAGLGDWKMPHKWLLLSALGDLLPDEIKHRPKQGFTPPVQDWIMKVLERYQTFLDDDPLVVRYGITDGKTLRHVMSNAPIYFKYKLLVLETWMRTVFLTQYRV